MTGPVQARVANGVSGNPFTYRNDNKAPANAPSRPENWAKLPRDNVYRQEWDKFAQMLGVNGQDKSARPLILNAVGNYFNKVMNAAARNVPVADSARMEAVKETRAEYRQAAAAQQPGWTERLTESVKTFDPFTGVETLAAKGLRGLADSPAFAGTEWGQALGRVATGVGTIGAFKDGVRAGAWEGAKSMVTGIATMAGKALQYGADKSALGAAGDGLRGLTGKLPSWLNATIPSNQRGAASDAAIGKATANVASYLASKTPGEVAGDIGNVISKSWNSLKSDHAAAAAKGPEAEARWWGEVVGRVTFEVAATFVPVAGVAGKVSGGARAAEAGADALRVADKVGDVAKGAEALGDAVKVGEKAADGLQMASKAATAVRKFPKYILETSKRTGIPPQKIQEILDIPKPRALGDRLRPDPSTYLSKAKISAHLTKFDEGAIRFTSKSSFAKRGTLGPEGGFVMPAREFSDLMLKAKGDLKNVEKVLGLDPGTLSSGDTLIALIEKKDLSGIRIPSGNEGGAHPTLWRPGGYTNGGISEAVMDFTKATPYKEVIL